MDPLTRPDFDTFDPGQTIEIETITGRSFTVRWIGVRFDTTDTPVYLLVEQDDRRFLLAWHQILWLSPDTQG